jgi:hypothetical protein
MFHTPALMTSGSRHSCSTAQSPGTPAAKAGLAWMKLHLHRCRFVDFNPARDNSELRNSKGIAET